MVTVKPGNPTQNMHQPVLKQTAGYETGQVLNRAIRSYATYI